MIERLRERINREKEVGHNDTDTLAKSLRLGKCTLGFLTYEKGTGIVMFKEKSYFSTRIHK